MHTYPSFPACISVSSKPSSSLKLFQSEELFDTVDIAFGPFKASNTESILGVASACTEVEEAVATALFVLDEAVLSVDLVTLH